MKLKDNPTRRVRIMIHETEANKMVPGSSRCMAVYETTSQEVFDIVQAAIKYHISKAEGR